MTNVFKELKLYYRSSGIPISTLSKKTKINEKRLKSLLEGNAPVIYLGEFVKIKDAIRRYNEENGKVSED